MPRPGKVNLIKYTLKPRPGEIPGIISIWHKIIDIRNLLTPLAKKQSIDVLIVETLEKELEMMSVIMIKGTKVKKGRKFYSFLSILDKYG